MSDSRRSEQGTLDAIRASVKSDDSQMLSNVIRSFSTQDILSYRVAGKKLLGFAIEHNARHCVRLLSAKGFKVDEVDEFGIHPLQEALDRGAVATFETLLRLGADPHAAHTVHGTILHAVASVRLIDSLLPCTLARKADPNLPGPRGRTPLHMAVLAGQVQNVTQLLDAGARSNAPDEEGLTPLHLALDCDAHQTIIQMLLSYGADPRKQDFRGRMPIEIATEKDLTGVVKDMESETDWDRILSGAAPKSDQATLPEEFREELLTIIRNGDRRKLGKLLSTTAGRTRQVTNLSRAPLLSCFSRQRLDMAAQLIRKGVGIFDSDEEGRGAAHYLFLCVQDARTIKPFLAALYKQSVILLSVTDHKGHKPLDIAAISEKPVDFPSLVQALSELLPDGSGMGAKSHERMESEKAAANPEGVDGTGAASGPWG